MYHLLKSIYLHATSREEYSIILLGLDNAGKTTLLEQIKALPSTSSTSYTSTNPQSTYTPNLATVPTVGQNLATILQSHPPPAAYLKIWDVGGQQALRGLWENYYDVVHGIVFVVDSSDLGDGELTTPISPSFAHSAAPSARSAQQNLSSVEGAGKDRLYECAITLASILSSPALESIPLLVLANKQDREDSLEVVRIKEGFVRRVFESQEVGGKVRDSRVLPCSALTGEGVREAVEWLGSRVRWNREGRMPGRR